MEYIHENSGVDTMSQKNITISFSRDFAKFKNPTFSTIRLHNRGFEPGTQVNIIRPKGWSGVAEVICCIPKKLNQIPLRFLVKDCETKTPIAAFRLLKQFYKNLTWSDDAYILRLKWIRPEGNQS